ncbi:23S rRNA (adenine(2030)-N(6))-methyltransferase RlmJ [Chromatiaceae bacterium AAb-1]|nr:23S rRNA (adenine(2030)-N(6))-methyltransferase RlmJ [Chromatiaceae bacterium AAb-1]
MLSYRHSFHAGNHADVIKHLTEVAILQYLKKKDKPFCYHDTHAGAGLYSLHSEQAQKTSEYQTGIGRLWHYQAASPVLQSYIELVKNLNPDDNLDFYPGSPKIAQLLLRDTDSIQCTELHPADYPILASQFSQRRHSRIEQMDAYAGFKAMLPPLHKRGLILIDPPYELKTEYQDLVAGIQLAYKRFPQATYAIWYPVIERSAIESVIQAIIETQIRNMLRIEFCPQPDSPGFGMTGSGMLVINPPYTLANEMQQALTELQSLLGATGSHWQVTQLVDE